MTEAKESDVTKYSTLGELFSRELVPEFRPLDKEAFVVSLLLSFPSSPQISYIDFFLELPL